MERIARRKQATAKPLRSEAARPNYSQVSSKTDKYDGKISLCYFSLVLFSKSALRLILKIKLRFTKT